MPIRLSTEAVRSGTTVSPGEPLVSIYVVGLARRAFFANSGAHVAFMSRGAAVGRCKSLKINGHQL